MTAQQLAAKLAPLGCKAMPPSDTSEDIGIKPKTELDCTINGEDVTIDEYLNAQQVAHNDGLAKGVGCAFAKSFGLTELNYVEDDNWTVSPDTTSTAQAIQRALGGKLITLHC